MSDLISRQDTIDAIISLTNCTSVRDLYVYVQEHNLADMWTGGVNDAIDAVIAVPSVQPDLQPACNQLATDTISRQAAIDALLEAYPDNMDVEFILGKLPSVQPEDCDTCKHGYFGDDQCERCRVRYPSHYERRTDG